MSWPTVDWMPGVERNQRLHDAPYSTNSNPKGLLHTSEGFSIQASENACANGGFDPHFTMGPDPSGAHRVKIVQHYPLSSRATALENDEITGGLTNRQAVIQVELVGTCDPKYKTHPLYIHNWADWYWDGIAGWMAWIEKVAGVPHKAAPKWTAYPGSYGLHAPQRMSWDEYCQFSGWIGHQHAAGNVHGDPGDLDVVGKLLSRFGQPKLEPKSKPSDPTPEPEPESEDDDVAYKTRPANVKPWGHQKLPHNKYATVAFGRSDKGGKIVSLLDGGEYAPGPFTAQIDLTLQCKSRPDHFEVLFYKVDASKQPVKVSGKYKLRCVGTWHTNGLYRLDVTQLGWIGGPHERLRVQIKSDFKDVTIVDTDYRVRFVGKPKGDK